MDWNYWLSRKYDLLQQNANADTSRANAGMVAANASANLDTVRAGLLPGQSKADIGLTNAQAGLANATTNQQNIESQYIGPKTLADIFATRAQGGYYNSQSAVNNGLARGMETGDTFDSNPYLERLKRGLSTGLFSGN